MYVDGPKMTVEATARAPSGVAVRGHARWDTRRLFHELEVTVRDANGWYTSSQCALHHVWTVPVFNTTTNVTKMEWRSAPAVMTSRKVDAQGLSTTTVVVGPYEKGYLITPKCRASAKDGAIKYTVWATSAFQMKLLARLIAGIALLLIAPVVANSVTCFYTLAMTLSTLALAMIVLHRFSRLIPGGRMMKRSVAFAGFATYYFVPAEQWQSVMDMYMQVSVKPAMMVFQLLKRRYMNTSLETIIAEDPWALYGALTGFGLLVLGAGVGRWLVKSFVLDAVTGGVAGPVRSSVTMFIRLIGCGLIQFSSRDVPCATAMVTCAVAYCLYAPVVRASDRIVDAAGRLVGRGASSSHETDDEEDDNDHGRMSDSESESEVERTRGGLHALGLRRRRPPLPETLDPEPRTPPRRLDARSRTPDIPQRSSFFTRVPIVSWFTASQASMDARARRRSGAADVPPVGSAARAHGRFLSIEEHDVAAAITTDRALDELAKSPEFAVWLAKNAHRIRVSPR